MTPQRIMLVDNEEGLCRMMEAVLRDQGYQVKSFTRPVQAVAEFSAGDYDLIISDIKMPEMDGLEVLRGIRSNREIAGTPVIMLTAKGDETDRIVGLELGADDYIPKPFSPREVVARVQAVLRRLNRQDEGSSMIRVGPIAVNLDEHWATVDDEPLELTTSEFELLATLARRPKRVFSRGELLEQVQGYGHEGYDRTIDTHIKNLRKKLGAVAPGLQPIESVYGLGYRYAP